MKKIVALVFAVCALSCDQKKETEIESEEIDLKNEQPVVDSARECFLWTKGKDSITMEYTRKANNVSGKLRYAWFEKDKNDGTFVGVFDGDTLRADYTFQSEGMTSVREIVFVRNGEKLLQGNGEMTEKDNKVVFVDRKLDFTNTIELSKTQCD